VSLPLVGKKIFKHKQGELRVSAFDLLNNNNNIQHTIADSYIQDMRTNVLHLNNTALNREGYPPRYLNFANNRLIFVNVLSAFIVIFVV